jgi:sulfoxide reductase heme-binding subunit YedZ
MTSNDWGIRRLRQSWKPLQRCVYLAAVLTLAHWFFLEYRIGPALVHFLPLAALECYRIIRNFQQSNDESEGPASTSLRIL